MDRREFLGMGACAAALAAGGCVSVGGGTATSGGGRRSCPFRIGVAGYTLVKFSLDESLKLLQKWGVSEFCAKSFHYPMTASAKELKDLVLNMHPCASRHASQDYLRSQQRSP